MKNRRTFLDNQPRPLIFAHRGCSSEAPENTLAAFRLARDYGVPGLELDIQRCASGELVVCHDASLLRTGGVDRMIEDCAWSEIRDLDLGSWFDSRFRAERLPLLDQVLEEFGQHFYIDIELKTRRVVSDALPVTAAELLQRHPAARTQNLVISSFNPFALRAFKKAAPEYATAVIYNVHKEVPWIFQRGQGRYLASCDFLKPNFSLVTASSVQRLSHLGGWPLVAWTVDEVQMARKLLNQGCVGLVSNRPQDLIREIQPLR